MTINYPNGTNHNEKMHKLQAPRGMLFEHELNDSNKYYLAKNMAVIYKKPTPVQIVKVDYPKRSQAKIVEAYYQVPSTTDYNGIYRGKYIDYEAKQTNALSFSFEKIFPHQIEHLKKVKEHGGIAFVIIYFNTLGKVYLMDISKFYELYLKRLDVKGRKSIKAKDFESLGAKEAHIGYAPRIDYLKAVDELYFNNN